VVLMPRPREDAETEAIQWIVRLRSASADDWMAFTDWLERDRANSDAYDQVALADEDYINLQRTGRRPVVPATAGAVRERGRARLVGSWALAAALVAMVSYSSVPRERSAFAVETKAGERRLIELPDGSRIALNGSTRIVMDRNDPRTATLESGEALFTVVHDGLRPFRVKAGAALLKDAGTVFNLLHEGNRTEVTVAEGAVLYNPQSDAVNLTPGMALRKDGRDVVVSHVQANTVGDWRRGRLTYYASPVSQIARDLARNVGVPVTVAPEVGRMRFTGVIVIADDQDQLFRRVAALIGVDARRSDRGWLLTAGTGEIPSPANPSSS
jgi:transmembrane sensor